MKILHTVKLYHPSTGGMYEVVRQISEHLVQLGHDVTVATTKLPDEYKPDLKGVKIKEFDISGNFVSGMSGEIEKYQDFLIDSDFDIITNFAAQQIMTDAMLPILDKIKAKKVFVPTGFAAFRVNEYQDYYKKMKAWFKKFDANIFLSDDYQDINYARESGAKNITVIPNGASSEEFLENNDIIDIRKKLDIPANNFLILHVGSHTGHKGHKEAIKIFKKAKIVNSTLLIIGNKGKCFNECKKNENLRLSEKGKQIIVTNSCSRKETVSAFLSANLFLFPSNAECSPVVLFEAMASKTPFLVTDVGNAKEIIKWSSGGVLLPTIHGVNLNNLLKSYGKGIIKKILSPFVHFNKEQNYNISKAKIKESAVLLEKTYNTNEEFNKLAVAGYTAWLEKFTWEKITQEYGKLYKSL
ncbi:MAG TPA: glycosyltransferase [Ignavibacteria bacterium]|nr:glycosyltransferase [Ignavibacteria bacterium]